MSTQKSWQKLSNAFDSATSIALENNTQAL